MSKVVRTETQPGLPVTDVVPIYNHLKNRNVSGGGVECSTPDAVLVKDLDNNALTIPLSVGLGLLILIVFLVRRAVANKKKVETNKLYYRYTIRKTP